MNNLSIEKKLTTRTRGVDRYFNEIKKHKLISVEREVELSELIKAGDTDALQELVNANLKFVVSVAKQYAASDPELLLDLVSQGNIGLIDAAKTYDATRGFKFISYAVWHIRKEILYYLMYSSRAIRVPQNINTAVNKAKQISQKFEQENGREIEADELKEMLLALDEKEYAAVDFNKATLHISGTVSLDSPLNEDGVTLTDMLESDQEINPFFKSERILKLKTIMEMCLKPSYIKIIECKLGLEDGYLKSWKQVAELTGRSPEMSRILFNKSIRLIRRFTQTNNISLADFEL